MLYILDEINWLLFSLLYSIQKEIMSLLYLLQIRIGIRTPDFSHEYYYPQAKLLREWISILSQEAIWCLLQFSCKGEQKVLFFNNKKIKSELLEGLERRNSIFEVWNDLKYCFSFYLNEFFRLKKSMYFQSNSRYFFYYCIFLRQALTFEPVS